MYSAIDLEACDDAFKALKSKCAAYHGAIKVWENNFDHVIQLINYPQDVRRIMHTTNAIESVNSSLRKVTKKRMFEKLGLSSEPISMHGI